MGLIYTFWKPASGTGFFELRGGKPDEILLICEIRDIQGYEVNSWFKQPELVRGDTQNYVYVDHKVENNKIFTKIARVGS